MIDRELVEHVAATTGLSQAEAERVVSDVVAYYRESVQDYVQRRHAFHHLHGVRNPQAFALIAEELSQRLFAPPVLSERQLRRIVYG